MRIIQVATATLLVMLAGASASPAQQPTAAAGNANVRALVYVAAFAPLPGEPVAAFPEKYPSDLGTSTVPDAAGFVYIDPAKYPSVFAGDIPERQARAMAVAQKPIFGGIFGQSNPAAAWAAVPAGTSSPGRTARSARSCSGSTPRA